MRPSRRKLAAAAVAIALAAGLTFSAAPAFAADDTTPNPGGWSEFKFNEYIKKMTQPMDPTKPRKFYPLTPSASKFRGFMINTLGSVLGAAAPGAWQAEQMANKHKYDHSWEKFEQDFQSKSAGGAPQSYQDYVLGKKDWKSKNQDKVPKNSPPPATKANPIRKGINNVGGIALGLTAMPIGFAVGNAITEMFGFSATEGEICGLDKNPINIGVGMISGVDCDAFKMTQDAMAVANADQQISGNLSGFGYNLTLSGVIRRPDSTLDDYCFKVSTTSPQAGVKLNISFPEVNRLEQFSPPFGTVSSGGSRCAVALGGSAYTIVFISDGFGSAGKMYLSLPNGTKSEEMVPRNGDPDRTMSCSITGSNGQTYTQQAAFTYRESEGRVTPPDCPALPEGVVPQNVSVNDGQGNKLYDEPTTQPYRDWATGNPDCADGSCPLDLLIKTTDGSSIASCFDLGAGCDGWHESADRDTRFECRYGGKKVDLKECYAYAGVFNEARQTVGAPYSDPKTGVWTGGQSSPTAASQSMNQPVQNPNQSRQCLEKGWAQANPVEWVLVPVKCALEWAAVPRPTVVMKTQVDIKNSWEGTAFGEIGTLTAPFGNIPIHSGCSGLPIKADFSWPKPWGIDWQLGAACSGPLAIAAGVTKTVAGGLIIVGGLLALSSYMGWSIGFRGFGRER